MTPLAGEDLVPSPPGTTDPLVSPMAVCLSVYSGPGVLRLLASWEMTSQAHDLSSSTFPSFLFIF